MRDGLTMASTDALLDTIHSELDDTTRVEAVRVLSRRNDDRCVSAPRSERDRHPMLTPAAGLKVPFLQLVT